MGGIKCTIQKDPVFFTGNKKHPSVKKHTPLFVLSDVCRKIPDAMKQFQDFGEQHRIIWRILSHPKYVALVPKCF